MKETAEKMDGIISDAEKFLSRIDEKDSYFVPGSKWCIKEILGHLIDSACNNHQRFIRLQSGNLIGFRLMNRTYGLKLQNTGIWNGKISEVY